jgi:chromosome segregation ATPase
MSFHPLDQKNIETFSNTSPSEMPVLSLLPPPQEKSSTLIVDEIVHMRGELEKCQNQISLWQTEGCLWQKEKTRLQHNLVESQKEIDHLRQREATLRKNFEDLSRDLEYSRNDVRRLTRNNQQQTISRDRRPRPLCFENNRRDYRQYNESPHRQHNQFQSRHQYSSNQDQFSTFSQTSPANNSHAVIDRIENPSYPTIISQNDASTYSIYNAL